MSFKHAAALALALMSSAALGNDFPVAECKLNDDASSAIVTAVNGSEIAYQCVVQCRANVTGQRAFFPVNCQFNLPSNAAAKTVCSFDGEGPKHFSKIGPTKYTCVPR